MLFLVTSVVSLILSLLLGVVIYFRNPKSWINRYFLIMSIFISVWIATLYVYYTTIDPQLLLWFGRVNFAAPTLSILYMYLFVREFPRKTVSFGRLFDLILGLLVWSIALIAGFTSLVDQKETFVNGERLMEFGPLYGIWIAVFLLVLVLNFSLMLIKYQHVNGEEKTQIKLILIALGGSFGFGFITNALLPYVFRIHIFEPFGPVGGFFLTGITSYAIVKHKFLDFTTVVARVVSHALILMAIVALEVGFLYAAVWILPPAIDKVFVAASGAVVIVLAYDWLRNMITRFTEKVLFQGRYDTEEVLKKLTKVMVSTIEIRGLSRRLLQILVGEMRITQGAFVLVREGAVTNIESVNWPDARILRSIPVESLMDGKKSIYVFEELHDEELKERMREIGATVMVPLSTKEEDIGLLFLGPKSSGDVYSERDQELLTIFGPQAAVAMNNARSYQEIERFSKTLEKKVEERTEELKQAQRKELERAKELLKIKDEFVFIATHDLATPVTAIAGFLDLVKAKISKIPKDLREDIEAIDEATVRLRTLVNDLLEVARGQSGTIKFRVVPVNIVEIIEGTVRLLEPQAEERKIKLKTKLEPKFKMVMSDQAKLAEVMENLIGNAVKYNKDRGWVEVETKKSGDYLIIEVRDGGIGIPETEQDKVFSKFFRSESEETRKQPGTGLGMFVTKMLVDKMRGKISFTSKEGEGTTFKVELKLASDQG